MKSIWNGTITFGLVSIPVRLFTAVETQSSLFKFKMLCAKCHEPITYERYCKHCGKQVEWKDIVKGLKLDDGTYFIVTPEKLKELKPEKTDTITIFEFVDISKVSLIYYDAHYYLAPEKKSERAYILFLMALQKSNKVALAKFVMKDKEYICALSPYQDILLLTTLNYTYEIRDYAKISPLVNPDALDISKAELDLALLLINQITAKKFDISGLRDEYSIKLEKAIKQGKKIKAPKELEQKKQPKIKKEESLLALLKSSLKEPAKRKRSVAKKTPATKKPVTRTRARRITPTINRPTAVAKGR